MQAVLTRAFARRLSKDYAVRSLFSTNANAEGANKRVRKATTIRPDLHNISHHVDLPPEKFSLSSGLALNRFEKDFVIYPEYSDADSAARIKSFTEKLRNELCEALTKTMPSDGILPDPVSAVLKRNALSTIYVPDEYGGMGMCNKDLLCISEVLGIDFNVYMALTQIQLVVNAITVYGTQQQKEDLLPKIASGELRPAICLFDDNGNFDFTSMRTTSTVCGDGMEKISGHKNVVIGAADANLLLIFANRKSPLQPSGCLVCYVVDKDSLPNGAVTVTSRLRTLGLHALHLSNVELRDVSVTSANVLGSGADGHDIALELSASNSFTYGAAVVGFLKSLTAELVRFCNTTVQYNALLSENRGVQHVFTELCLATFVLESMSYYIGGLLDEELVVSTDIETAVIHKFANRVLRLAISTAVEVLGAASCDKEFHFERNFRDAITMMSLSNAESNLTEQISLGTLTTWASANANRLLSWRSGKSGALRRMFGAENEHAQMSNPKLVHFIAEHVHPSLENACRDLEQTMSRLNTVISKLAAEQGKRIETDFGVLCSLSSVVENNLGMVAVISRASRSYSIGLRNADLELAWALTYCCRAARDSFTELHTLLDYFHLVRSSPSLLQIGRAALEMGGYCLESPVEKNW